MAVNGAQAGIYPPLEEANHQSLSATKIHSSPPNSTSIMNLSSTSFQTDLATNSTLIGSLKINLYPEEHYQHKDLQVLQSLEILDLNISKLGNRIIQLESASSFMGKPSISFYNSDKQRLLGSLKHVLIAKFTHGRPSLASIEHFFLRMQLKGEFSISVCDSKHVFIECNFFEDFVKLWIKRIWVIQGFPARLFKWSEHFHPSKESSITPVWIHLPGLPLYLFKEGALLKIGNAIGSPLLIHSRNLTRKHLGCASLCVEIDVSKPLIDEVYITFSDKLTGESTDGFWQTVRYDKLPSFCSACNHLGHTKESCLRTNKMGCKPANEGHKNVELAGDFTVNNQKENREVWPTNNYVMSTEVWPTDNSVISTDSKHSGSAIVSGNAAASMLVAGAVTVNGNAAVSVPAAGAVNAADTAEGLPTSGGAADGQDIAGVVCPTDNVTEGSADPAAEAAEAGEDHEGEDATPAAQSNTKQTGGPGTAPQFVDDAVGTARETTGAAAEAAEAVKEVAAVEELDAENNGQPVANAGSMVSETEFGQVEAGKLAAEETSTGKLAEGALSGELEPTTAQGQTIEEPTVDDAATWDSATDREHDAPGNVVTPSWAALVEEEEQGKPRTRGIGSKDITGGVVKDCNVSTEEHGQQTEKESDPTGTTSPIRQKRNFCRSELEGFAKKEIEMLMATPTRVAPVFEETLPSNFNPYIDDKEGSPVCCFEVIETSPRIADVRKHFQFLKNENLVASLKEQGKYDTFIKDVMDTYTKEIYLTFKEHQQRIYTKDSTTEKATPLTQEATTVSQEVITDGAAVDKKEWTTVKRRSQRLNQKQGK